MRLAIILTIIGALQANARSFSQVFTISGKKVTIKEIVSQIEKTSNFKFLYQDEVIDSADRVDIEVYKQPIEQVLGELLANSNLGYKRFDDNLIVLTRATSEKLQAITVSGTIVSGRTEEPVPGASIILKGTTKGTVSDPDGKFSIEVPSADAVLIVSSIGYLEEEINVGGRTRIDVRLIESIENLEEVVVVGYGLQKKATVTGAISSAKGVELLKTPVTNVTNSLVGHFTGLIAVQRSGEPGQDGTSLLIRGQNSLNSNSPLYVVDGIAGRSFDRIDPADIESVTVLKDASAAIYGAQAANGVILVTTKRGASGKTRVTINVNQGVNQPTVLPKMTNAAEYATYVNEILKYGNRPAQYTQNDIDLFANGTDPWGHPSTNFLEEVIKPYSSQNNQNITVSGGSDKMRYHVSFGHRFQDGNYRRSAVYYEQYNVRANIDGQVSKNISLALDIAGRQEDRNGASLNTTNDLWRFLLRSKPTMHAYWPNGMPGPDIEKGLNPAVITTKDAGYNNNKQLNLESNAKVNIKVPWVKGLSLTGNFSIDKGNELNKTWQQPWNLYYWDGQTKDASGTPVLKPDKRGLETQLSESMQIRQTLTWNALVNYDFSLGNHDAKILFGHERSTFFSDILSASRKGYSTTALQQIDLGSTAGALNGGMSRNSARLNYFGRMNYSYSQKYLLEFVWRYDGSTKFARGKQFGFFPGVSAGWRVSEEDFWKNNIDFIDNFKLKGSWGQTGNDRINDYQYLSSYAYFTDSRGNFVTGTGNGNQNLMLFESTVRNANVTWERATQTDIGFEMQLLNNKVSVSGDYFNNLRTDILWHPLASLPAMTGITNPPYSNLGKVTVSGVEGEISYSDKVGELNFNISGNASYNKSRVKFMDEDPSVLPHQKATGRVMGNYPNVAGDNLYYVADGVYKDEEDIANSPKNTLTSKPLPGDLKFKDVDANDTINSKDRIRSNKNATPNFIAGLNVSVSYKGFDMSFLIQGAAGAELLNVRKEAGEDGNVYSYLYENRWSPENNTSNIPRAHNGKEYFAHTNPNTFYLYSSDYIRLKNFEIGYSLPQNLLKFGGIESLRIYINGSNLVTFSELSKKLGFDPEIGNSLGQSYPLVRVFNAGINLTF